MTIDRDDLAFFYVTQENEVAQCSLAYLSSHPEIRTVHTTRIEALALAQFRKGEAEARVAAND